MASVAQEDNMGLFDNLWVERYRPKTLSDTVLTPTNKAFFENIQEKQEIPHLMLSGPPGIGKSVMAKVIVNEILNCQYVTINASEESGIDTIRSKIMNFAQTRSIDGKTKVVICEEADGLSSVSGNAGRTSAQQALRNVMEEYAATTRFILTCNYPYKIIPALHSRCQSLDLTPPFEECVKRCANILKKEKVAVDKENKERLYELVKNLYPDLRKIINTIQKNTIGNILNIQEFDSNLEFATIVFDKIVNNNDIMKVREYVIKNEINFSNDYGQLLVDLHETIYLSSLDIDTKRNALIHIGVALLNHEQVMDREINFFTCILEISKLF